MHGRSSVIRLEAPGSTYYLKCHQDLGYWANEVHASSCWAPVFGAAAPRLLGVHEVEPLALLFSELPGKNMMGVDLPMAQERAVWRQAGRALVVQHELQPGDFFGRCRRDGSPAGDPVNDAETYVDAEFSRLLADGKVKNLLDESEIAIIQAARQLTPAFAGEQPTACHRDYGPDNWLVAPDGSWSGVIDFEFAHWDVRAIDFSRYPNWEWIHRPDLLAAFFEGYGRHLTPLQETQTTVARTLYALGAIVWGHGAEFYGFEAEGRLALKHLKDLLP